MRILVTGSDGFIGSHLTEALVKQGYEVKAFTLYNSFDSIGWLDTISEEVKNQIEIFKGDIRDPNCVRQAMKNNDVVLHLAALIGIPYSYYSPDSYVDTNVKGTLNLLQAARDEGARFVHTSTSEVYGTAQFVPITEKHPLQGQSPYSASKIAADQLAYSFLSSFNVPVTIIRPFNTYGPRQSTRAVIPTIILQLLTGNENICLGSLRPTRDFNFVSDTVEGFISAIDCEEAIGEVINIGSSFEISIGETANLIAEIMNKNIFIEKDEQRFRPKTSEVERLYSSNEKAEKILGWRPKHGGLSGFRSGIEKTVEWFSDPSNIQNYKSGGYVI